MPPRKASTTAAARISTGSTPKRWARPVQTPPNQRPSVSRKYPLLRSRAKLSSRKEVLCGGTLWVVFSVMAPAWPGAGGAAMRVDPDAPLSGPRDRPCTGPA